MVKITLKIDNKRYAILKQMSIESGIEINELIKLFIIKNSEDYIEKNNIEI